MLDILYYNYPQLWPICAISLLMISHLFWNILKFMAFIAKNLFSN